MKVYKTVLLQNGLFVSTIMNTRIFADPWLQKVYVLNETTYFDGAGFPLYAWPTEEKAIKAKYRFADQYIFECHAEMYSYNYTYVVSYYNALQELKDPSLRFQHKIYIKDMTALVISKNNHMHLAPQPHMTLCESITPLRCIG